MTEQELNVIITVLGLLIAGGTIAIVVKFVMRPMVVLTLIAVLGWVLYAEAIAG